MPAGAGRPSHVHAYINSHESPPLISAFKQHYYSNHSTIHLPQLRQNDKRNNMRGPNAAASTASKGGAMAAFKQGLLRNLLLGLRACSFDAAMSLQERKRAVKCSADVAMAAAAAAGSGRARWPKTILAAAAAASSSSHHSPGGGTCKVWKTACCRRRVMRRRVDAKRRILRGAAYAAASGAAAAASCDDDVARRLVRRRTMALRKVIPGGNAAAMMDDAALLRETMDYVVHLRAQVDVLRRVSAAVQRSAFLRDPSQDMGES
ncbi:hypothetical protein SORBI_3010G212800 [Sorghum bicolor]|uniref:IBH1-like N-terminal domain-containing protein n=2 Tax=Sorghum bicolor TaxID=4558 RepID=A0A194YKK8_SORBI|nr:hypothetical protein SORBI_3010G212800 [Sorghum bicolor]OQU76798.1 hypothetical protein SORBI_3010G212800 [Sorghum bicolor]